MYSFVYTFARYYVREEMSRLRNRSVAPSQGLHTRGSTCCEPWLAM